MRHHLKKLLLAILFITLLPFLSLAESLESSMQENLEKSQVIISRIYTNLGTGTSVASDFESLIALNEDIEATHMLLESRYRSVQEYVDSFSGSKASDRNSQMMSIYLDTIEKYLEIMSTIETEDDITAEIFEDLETIFEKAFPKTKRPIYGSLPYKKLGYTAKLPLAEPQITPAYKGGDMTVTDADLAATPEAPISKEIAEKAESLNWNPVEIYEYVKNDIETEWYWGLMKGAEETMRQGSGNDCDQAALLVALLRASGYPSRYVRGVIEFFPDIERAKALVGVKDDVALLTFFQKAGIPFRPVYAGTIKNVQIEHVWVETQVPYSNYRGAIIDEHGKTWLGLDTSIKAAGFNENEPINILEEIQIRDLRDEYLETPREDTPLAYIQEKIGNYLSLNHPDKTYEDTLYTRTQVPENLNILPAGLQFIQLVVTGEYTQMPEALMHKVHLNASDLMGHELFDTVFETFKVCNQQIVVSYEPETVEDQEIINSFGGFENTPAYLLRLRPVLLINNERVAFGSGGLPMGEEYEITIDLVSPDNTPEDASDNTTSQVKNPFFIGNVSVIGITAPKSVLPYDLPEEEIDAEWLLYKEALHYLELWGRSEDELAALLDINLVRPIPSVVTLGGLVEATYLLGSPYDFEWKGIFVDADLRVVETVEGYAFPDPADDPGKIFMQLSALEGSFLENAVIEEDLGVECISTAKLFGLANTDANVAILSINQENIDTILSTINFADNIKEDIINAVNKGLEVKIPDLYMTYEDWQGIGYIKEDLETGEAGWMLSGMIAGGMSAIGFERWPEAIRDQFKLTYSEPAVLDPLLAMYITKVTTTDMQQGIVGQPLQNPNEEPEPLTVRVLDIEKFPVAGVPVTFTVKAGGGYFSKNKSSIIVVPTDLSGYAKAEYTLGQKTDESPAYWNTGKEFPQQVGENLIDASISSNTPNSPSTSISRPFTAYGFPSKDKLMWKIIMEPESEYEHAVQSFASFLYAKLVDKYDNPISNEPLTFTALAAIPGECELNADQPALTIAPDHPCLAGKLSYSACQGSGANAVTLQTSPKGAGVYAFTGGTSDASYPIEITHEDLKETHTFLTKRFGSCGEDAAPSIMLELKGLYSVDTEGYNLNANSPGEEITLLASMRFVKEDGKIETGYPRCTDSDNNVHTGECPFIVGAGTFSETTDFVSENVTFAGNPGTQTASGSGIFKYDYTLEPGVNFISVDGEATISTTVKSIEWTGDCESYDCVTNSYNEDREVTGQRLVAYGVEITNITPSVKMPVDENGYLNCDVNISYTIEPEEYTASTAYVNILKNGQVVDTIGAERSGSGFAVISKGFLFDLEAEYTAEVVLNTGTESEIKSDEIALNLGEVVIKQLYLEDELSSLPINEPVKVKAETIPANHSLEWRIVERANGVEAEIDSSTGVITVTEINQPEGVDESSWVIVEARDPAVDCVSKESTFYICLSCEPCSVEGGGKCENNSVDVTIGLGRSKGGQQSGSLHIKATRPSSGLCTPNSLNLSTIAKDVESRYQYGALRQVLTARTLVDIDIEDRYGYNINFYRPDQIDGELSGYYRLVNDAEPFTVWRIENPDRSLIHYNRLHVTEIKDNTTRLNEYVWSDENSEWTLIQGGGLKISERIEITDNDLKNRIVTETIKDIDENIASMVRTTYHKYPWGEEVIETVNDPEGFARATVNEYYDDVAETSGSYSRIKSRTSPEGSVTSYQYDDDGKLQEITRSWLDDPAGRTVHYDYTPVDAQDAGESKYEKQPRTVTESIAGNVVSKTYYAYRSNNQDERVEIVERCASLSAGYGDADNMRTETVYYQSGTDLAEAGKIKSVMYPDGRMDTYVYEEGAYSEGSAGTPGSFTAGSGEDRRQIVVHGTSANPNGIANKTTREISIQDETGNMLMNETQVYTGSGYERILWTVYAIDEYGRITDVYNSDGIHTTTHWGCCTRMGETDARGITTSFGYDGLNRLETSTKERGGQLADDIETTYTYDAAGRTMTQTVSAGSTSLLLSQNEYDGAGRLDFTVDTAGLLTDYNYDPTGLVTTVTRPGGATEITTRYLDGRTKSITGTGAVSRYYTYGVNSNGTQWTQVNISSENSPMWEKTTTDMLGRTISVEKPGYTGTEITLNHYNQKGQLYKTSAPGQADMLYEYNDLGEQTRSGLDLDNNNALDNVSGDRINETETAYALISSEWWQQTIQRVYAVENNGASKIVGTQRTQVSGLGVGGEISETVSIDINGNETVSQVFINNSLNKETRRTDLPDSTIDAVSISINGLLESSQDKTGLMVTYGYDELGRRTGVTDPRTGTSTTHYNAKGQVDYIEDPLHNRLTYTYDPSTGEKVAETNALEKVTRYKYNDLGQVENVWGDAVYPVEYIYDDYGRMEQMNTWRTGDSWHSATWPSDMASSADATIWHYHEPSGLLEAKEDSSGKSVSYTYAAGGRLNTRTWARKDGVDSIVTTYGYDPDTAELTDIDYSDTTPDVTFTYDRLGRQKTVSDALGDRTFVYKPDTLQLDYEEIIGLYDKTITRTYETGDIKGRPTGFNIGSDYSVKYGYEADTGRFNSIIWTAGTATGSTAYNYVPSSNLLNSITTGSLTTTYEYEPNRNLKTQVENMYNSTLISQYDYEYDELGRRKNVKNSGTAFSNSAFNIFDYNDRNELAESSRYLGTDLNDTTNPVSGEYRDYDYDPIGNRAGITIGSDPGSYISNELNQYTQEAVPGGGTNSFAYDDDGNLTEITGNKNVKYAYNAENRLVSAGPLGIANEGDKRVEFQYDYMGRSVKKDVYTFSAGSWNLTSTKLFVYDGWNLIQELDGLNSNAVLKSYVWGLDYGGGIGGLLASIDGTDIHYYCYDANGNVGQILNASNGSVEAHYEYDPFGNEIYSYGSLKDDNSFRFSTKRFDTETGLYYYGFRYYSPELGRWLNRDPIQEMGGINLYVFVYNNATNSIDPYGLIENIINNPQVNNPITWKAIIAGIVVAGETILASPALTAVVIVGGSYVVYEGVTYVIEDTWVTHVPGEIAFDIFEKIKDIVQGRTEADVIAISTATTMETRNSCCSFEWCPPKGGNPVHLVYAARLNGGVAMELEVTTPKGDSVSYDAAVPGYPSLEPELVIEAKTGHYWTRQPNPPPEWIATRAVQFSEQAAIAIECNLPYIIAVDNPIGANGLKTHLPMFPIFYVP